MYRTAHTSLTANPLIQYNRSDGTVKENTTKLSQINTDNLKIHTEEEWKARRNYGVSASSLALEAYVAHLKMIKNGKVPAPDTAKYPYLADIPTDETALEPANIWSNLVKIMKYQISGIDAEHLPPFDVNVIEVADPPQPKNNKKKDDNAQPLAKLSLIDANKVNCSLSRLLPKPYLASVITHLPQSSRAKTTSLGLQYQVEFCSQSRLSSQVSLFWHGLASCCDFC
jgi:hypothetical protein